MRLFLEGRLIADEIKVANKFFLRLRGLLGRKSLDKGEGLLLKPCGQVHTWFMAFAIDIIFLDSGGQIVGLTGNLQPGTWSPRVKEASQVLEMAAGAILQHDFQLGKKLELK